MCGDGDDDATSLAYTCAMPCEHRRGCSLSGARGRSTLRGICLRDRRRQAALPGVALAVHGRQYRSSPDRLSLHQWRTVRAKACRCCGWDCNTGLRHARCAQRLSRGCSHATGISRGVRTSRCAGTGAPCAVDGSAERGYRRWARRLRACAGPSTAAPTLSREGSRFRGRRNPDRSPSPPR